MSKGTVAIIGAGIGGLSAARYLAAQGFSPTIFESYSDLGGQWNRENPKSGVWPQMRTNTARFVTKLSGSSFPEDVAMFPRNGEILDMVNEFVDRHGLRPMIKFGVEVVRLSAGPSGGYEVSWTAGGEVQRTEHFDRAIVASGRFNKPELPNLRGAKSFTGAGGIIHAFRYKDPERYRGMRVVVCGGSISALEIASDLSMLGTERVHLSQRRQRYVMPKMYAGTPLEYITFTREGAIALETMQAEKLLSDTKATLLRIGGDPARYGAPATHPDMTKAGVTGSQHYLNLVAEDRIDVRPWISRIDGSTVEFTDGSAVEADAIIIGTGFDLNLPFLDDDIAATVRLSRKGMELADFTFHPDLEGLAFIGLWSQLGPYPVVLEQQARYIAYSWGGAIEAPSREELTAGVADCVRDDHHGGYRSQHEMALRFARLAQADPGAHGDERFQAILSKSAVTGEMFRIVGPDALPDAQERFERDFFSYAPPEVVADIEARFPESTRATAAKRHLV